jgi:hypothetical protein
VPVDHELLAALEKVEQAAGPIRADHGGGRVDLGHREPTAGRGDRVALAGVRLLPHQQLVAGGLPGVPVDDRRNGRLLVVPGAVPLAAPVGGGHGLLLVLSLSIVPSIGTDEPSRPPVTVPPLISTTNHSNVIGGVKHVPLRLVP